MEGYQILTNLPKNEIFGPYDRKEVRAFGKWFMKEKDNRMQMLFDEIHRDPEFSDWQPDFTPDSLKSLSYWFERSIQAESLHEDEWQKLIDKHPGMMAYKNKRITEKSKSLIYDVGIYLGEILLRTLGDRQWEQNMKTSKRDVFYGHMVIPVIPTPVHKWSINPCHIVGTLAVKLIYDNAFEKEGLYVLFAKTLKTLTDYLHNGNGNNP